MALRWLNPCRLMGKNARSVLGLVCLLAWLVPAESWAQGSLWDDVKAAAKQAVRDKIKSVPEAIPNTLPTQQPTQTRITASANAQSLTEDRTDYDKISDYSGQINPTVFKNETAEMRQSAAGNILILHPFHGAPAFIEKTVTVDSVNTSLEFSVRGHTRGDFLARVVAVSRTGQQKVLYEKTIVGSRGWHAEAIDLSRYQGQSVTLRFEAHATGWHFEYVGLDYFFVRGDGSLSQSPQSSEAPITTPTFSADQAMSMAGECRNDLIPKASYGSKIGEFQGVVAKSNENCTGTFQGECADWQEKAKYQCVDYVKRFYGNRHEDITEVRSSWGSAQAFWDRKNHPNFSKYTLSEQVKELPKVGDMFFFDTGHPEGHVAIVTGVTPNKICIIQQNIKLNTAYATVGYSQQHDGRIDWTKKMSFPDGSTSKQRMIPLGWLSPNLSDPSVAQVGLPGDKVASTVGTYYADDNKKLGLSGDEVAKALGPTKEHDRAAAIAQMVKQGAIRSLQSANELALILKGTTGGNRSYAIAQLAALIKSRLTAPEAATVLGTVNELREQDRAAAIQSIAKANSYAELAGDTALILEGITGGNRSFAIAELAIFFKKGLSASAVSEALGSVQQLREQDRAAAIQTLVRASVPGPWGSEAFEPLNGITGGNRSFAIAQLAPRLRANLTGMEVSSLLGPPETLREQDRAAAINSLVKAKRLRMPFSGDELGLVLTGTTGANRSYAIGLLTNRP